VATTATSVSALTLVEQAVEQLTRDSIGRGDHGDDPRLGLLFQTVEHWEATDKRWVAARFLVAHDDLDPLMQEAMGLLVPIVDLLTDFVLDNTQAAPRLDADAAAEARDLRDAYERLGEIVRAVTAVPLLGE
jgi:hypothetical protein